MGITTIIAKLMKRPAWLHRILLQRSITRSEQELEILRIRLEHAERMAAALAESKATGKKTRKRNKKHE